MTEPKVLMSGLGLVESPRWHHGQLWFADWIAGEIIALDGKGRSSFQLLQGQDMGQGADTNRFSTLLICSGSTAKTFIVYRSKNERQNWKSC